MIFFFVNPKIKFSRLLSWMNFFFFLKVIFGVDFILNSDFCREICFSMKKYVRLTLLLNSFFFENFIVIQKFGVSTSKFDCLHIFLTRLPRLDFRPYFQLCQRGRKAVCQEIFLIIYFIRTFSQNSVFFSCAIIHY